MRYINEDACPIPGFAVGAYGAAVLQLFKDFKGLVNDVVRFFAPEAADEPGTAIVVFKFGQV
jgi:hypothetical protein